MTLYGNSFWARFSPRSKPIAHSDSSTRSARRRIAQAIESLEPRVMLTTVPNDPMYGQQWHLNNTGQTGGIPGADIDAQNAWDITTGSSDVVVAIIDSGLDVTHPDLAANVWVNAGEIPDNGIDDDQNGFVDDVNGWDFVTNTPDVTDLNGHGTNVAGIIGAVGNNGVGVTGVNWHVKLLPIKIGIGATNGVSFDAALKGIEYLTMMKHRGVNIVVANGSYGGTEFPFNNAIDTAIADAGRAGILFSFAAGNGGADQIGDNNDISQTFPPKYSVNNPNVIAVAATDSLDNLTSFSNFGAFSVNVGAPGLDIFSTFSRDADISSDGVADGIDYISESGTSQATPIVTGIIALEAAANPKATPAQLKAALLDSVELTPQLLVNPSTLQKSVSTGGRVNAYYAVRNIQNQFNYADTGTGGNWIGAYGAAGHFVVGEDNLFPDQIGVTLVGGAGHLVAGSSTDTRMPLKPSNPADRIGAYFTTPDTMTFNFDFQDGQSHRMTMYFADLEAIGRTQEVRIIDTATGKVLNYQGLADFQAGRYLSYDLQGSVQVQIHSTAPGKDAVVNAFYFDTPPSNPSRFVSTDTTTQGRWFNTYGSQGAFLVGQSPDFPSFVGVNLTGGAGRIVAGKKVQRDAASLQRIDDPKKNTLGYFATPGSMTFDMNFTDGQTHRMGIYAVDFEKLGRQERFDLIDADTGSVISSQVLSAFSGGKYLFWDVSGHVQMRVTRLSGTDAVVSGFFFDAPPGGPATFIGSDATTQGSWRGKYGRDGAFVVGDDQFSFPFGLADITGADVTQQVIIAHTAAKPALQRVSNPFDRIVGYLHSSRTFTMDMNFTDHQTHRVSIYAVDFDRQNRVEQIEMIDAATGQVISSQQIRDFSKGIYLTWDVRNHVQIRVTRIAGPTAVLSGAFFD